MDRKSIIIEGFNHGVQPIPAACRVGNLVITGGVYGIDPKTRKIAEGVDEQARCTFIQLGRILDAAGAKLDHVVRMTFYIKSPDARDAINREWLAAFPDENSRPARHTLHYEHLPAGQLLQCDATAMMPVGEKE